MFVGCSLCVLMVLAVLSLAWFLFPTLSVSASLLGWLVSALVLVFLVLLLACFWFVWAAGLVFCGLV